MRDMQQPSAAIRGTILAAMLVMLAHGSTSAQSPGAQASALTVAQILDRMAENTKALTSYVVPFRIDAHVKRGMFSVRVPLDGTRYYKVPDKSLLKMPKVPSEAKALVAVYSWVGTPVTWPSTYDISLESPKTIGTTAVYELRATYKPGATTHALLDSAAHSTVDHILLDVNSQTFDPVRATWHYRNGSTIVMNITAGSVDGKYRLPQHEDVDMSLPGQHATAQITYAAYQTNVAIPDSTFVK
jgi:hypothetical protein